MNTVRICCAASLLTAVLFCGAGPAAFAADEYGSVTGQFVIDGEVPESKLIVEKGDTTVKDAAVCAANDLEDETLVVDPATKGIANIFVYMRKAKKVHPDLKKSKEKTVVFDQKGCRFIPRTLFVRTDQTVTVKSDDDVAHNTHTYPFRNQAVNFLLKPKNRSGEEVSNRRAESLPTSVKCDIHPWMQAYWLILDHPYGAITDKTGRFTIDKLPVGEHEFRVWQERSGYVPAGEKRGFKVVITANETTDLGVIKQPPSEFPAD
jgi:plastocyanin